MRILYFFLIFAYITASQSVTVTSGGSTGRQVQQGFAYGQPAQEEGNVVVGVDNPPVMGNPTMFHYQTYPQQQYNYPVIKSKKRCIMTDKGKMKCKYRRDGE